MQNIMNVNAESRKEVGKKISKKLRNQEYNTQNSSGRYRGGCHAEKNPARPSLRENHSC